MKQTGGRKTSSEPPTVPQVSWIRLLLGSWRMPRAWQAVPEAGLTRAPAATRLRCRGWRSRPRASASVSSTTAWTATFLWPSSPSPVSTPIQRLFASSQEETHCCCCHGDPGLYVLQRIGSTQEGNASFSLSGDYYNRELSGRAFMGLSGSGPGCSSSGTDPGCSSSSRLGALHGALALLPELAAAGSRPPPPSTSEDGGSCQAQAGCKSHFCSVG